MTPTLSRAEFEAAVGAPLESFAGQCHGASLALVKAHVFDSARVARGSCPGVFGQHSWVVLGDDCYDRDALVVDPTLWSYDESVTDIWIGRADERPHLPHGSGSIWDYGRPDDPSEEIVELKGEFSYGAQRFLELLGPLDRRGWMVLANSPVGGWPAAEIVAAMYDDPVMSAWVPIDIVGMLTDRNPQGLYLP